MATGPASTAGAAAAKAAPTIATGANAVPVPRQPTGPPPGPIRSKAAPTRRNQNDDLGRVHAAQQAHLSTG
eukprot:4900048-Pyramimonas_sp.AAC.1